jgi:hypothetical protein
MFSKMQGREGSCPTLVPPTSSNMSAVGGFVQTKNNKCGGNEMKTIAAFTMALATLVLATAADADVQDRRCKGGKNGIGVRAGTPCLIRESPHSEIIEPSHNGTAVLRADGSIYYSPKPGFTGTDGMRVMNDIFRDCRVPEKLQANPTLCRLLLTTQNRRPYLTR